MASALPSGSWKKAWRQTPESIGSPQNTTPRDSSSALAASKSSTWNSIGCVLVAGSIPKASDSITAMVRFPVSNPGPACCPSALTRRDRDIRVEVASLLKVVRGHRDEVDAGDDARGWGHVALLNRGRSNPTPSTEGVGPQRRTPHHSVV